MRRAPGVALTEPAPPKFWHFFQTATTSQPSTTTIGKSYIKYLSIRNRDNSDGKRDVVDAQWIPSAVLDGGLTIARKGTPLGRSVGTIWDISRGFDRFSTECVVGFKVLEHELI